MAQDKSLKILLVKFMRKKVDWENEDTRLKFHQRLYPLIKNWIDGLPNLRDIFQQDEIERLLVDAINYDHRDENKNALVHRFIRFVISTGYKDEPKLDEEGNPVLHRNTPVHSAGRNETFWLPELFEIYNRFDVNFIDESGYTHFHAACSSCCTDVVKKFLEHGQNPDCLPREPNEHDPPIHLALKRGRREVCELLLSHGADPNLTNKDGLTPLHEICRRHSDVEYLQLFFSVSEQAQRPLQVNARNKFGNTPLHVAMYRGCLDMIEFLLRNGADPTVLNARGATPLHLVGESRDDFDWARLVGARDNLGRTMLHVVMNAGHLDLMGFLLAKGADPNAADDAGETPLHAVSRYAYLNYVAETFFKICDERKKTLKLDAKDERGWTPLYLAINSGSRYIAESLLARGADPNLANVDGETPLHAICSQGNDQTAELFFNICDEKKQIVQLDAKDNLGRTPLQYAVSKVEAYLVNLLLACGADLSSLVFPTEHEISEQLNDLPVALRVLYPPDFLSKWRRASRVANVVESLGDKGYAFDVSQVQSIMRALARHGFLEMSLEPEERLCLIRFLYSSSEFTVKAKKIMMTSSLSLYDLLKLRPEETKKLLTSTHYFSFADSGYLELLGTKELVEICVVLLCEMMMERFCKLLALVPFSALTHYRLPISHCEIILEKLPNEDLFKLCLLANGQN